MPMKSPRVKLNISPSASLAASGEAKGVAQLLETLDGEASWYPSEKVRVLGFLFDVKPSYSKEDTLRTCFVCATHAHSHFCPQHWLLCHLGLY